MKIAQCFTLLSIIVVLNSCTGGKTSLQEQHGKVLPTKPLLTLQRGMGGNLDIYFKMGEKRDTTIPKFQFINSIISANAVIQHPDFGALDTIGLIISSKATGIEYGKDSLIIEAGAQWENTKGLEYNTVKCELLFNTLDSIYYYAEDFHVPLDSSNENKAFMEVTPFIDEQSDTVMIFSLLAKRNRGSTNDYHPSSERYRVEIYTQKGVLIFSTNNGANYLQQIAPVEPRKRNDYKRYTYEWNLRDNEGRKLTSGKYKAVLSLVTKPKPYSVDIEFELK